jgi:hypothetical protein
LGENHGRILSQLKINRNPSKHRLAIREKRRPSQMLEQQTAIKITKESIDKEKRHRRIRPFPGISIFARAWFVSRIARGVAKPRIEALGGCGTRTITYSSRPRDTVLAFSGTETEETLNRATAHFPEIRVHLGTIHKPINDNNA